ncbi:hypothetical protein D3C73_767130 [compost metagenome]
MDHPRLRVACFRSGHHITTTTAATGVAARRAATDQRIAAGIAARRRDRVGQQVAVIDRSIQRERLEFKNVEAKLAHVAPLVLVRQRIHDRVVGGGQAVAGNDHTRWLRALAQLAEQLLCRLGQHQVGRLQDHFVLRTGDQCIQLRLGDVLPGQGCVGALAAMLARQIGHIAHRGDRQGGVHERAGDEGDVVGFLADPLHPLGPAELCGRQHRHALLEQGTADIVQALGRHAALRTPEGIEVGGHRACFGAGDQHVPVAEVVLAVPVVIVVLVVAPTDHADRIVNHQQLVVHALVEATEAAQHAAGIVEIVQPGLAERRVVDPQLEVLVGTGQCAEDLQVGDRRKLIDQQPYLHPASRRRQQLVDDQAGAVVLVKDVGLQVDAAGGAAQQVQARDQRAFALVQQGGVVPRLFRGRFAERPAGQGPQG